MNKIIIFLIAICLTVVSPLYALDKSGNFESIEEQNRYIVVTLKKMATEINSQTPMMIDSETQMSFVLALDKTINFTMKLVNLSSSELNADDLKNYVWGNVNDIACKDQATRDLIDLGVSYVYIYFGNDDRFINRVVLDKYNCNL